MLGRIKVGKDDDEYEEIEDDEEDEDEPKKPKKLKKEKIESLVVAQLPNQQVRRAIYDGEEYNLVTIEEAMTEMLRSIREIKQSVA